MLGALSLQMLLLEPKCAFIYHKYVHYVNYDVYLRKQFLTAHFRQQGEHKQTLVIPCLTQEGLSLCVA